ncbi:MAG TPA: M18 family aminopeptidase [Acidimicrobiales bacterium]|nr:M18 family aminopeptidase [Acidimicrobiales bacterium]
MTGSTRSVPDTGALRAFLDACPTPWHAAETAAGLLDAAGFEAQALEAPFDATRRRSYVRRGGSLIAWQTGEGANARTPMRIAAAHTDSPGFRIKPRPESVVAGAVRLGVEVYGGPLLNSWLDRDLGIAGTVLVGTGSALEIRPVIDSDALLRIPQLAIHLDRSVNDTGLKLDRQKHLPLLWGLDDGSGDFTSYVAELAGVAASQVRGWDLMPFDLTPARVCGRQGELLASARLDDLLSCHAAIEALVQTESTDEVTAVVALVDHEEVGSTSSTGADGTFVPQIIERIASASADGERNDFLVAMASSHAVSLDMAHATHPNHPERHDPGHTVLLDGGPVVKHNAQQRYATSLASMAPFLAACDAADVAVQHFVSHSEMPCGSTIGPALGSGLGIGVVDVGVAQLAMHSVREVCGSSDHGRLSRALTRYLSQT